MSKVFEELEKGLKEAIQIEKGELKGKKTVYTFLPIKKYSNKQVKKIRNDAGMTQNVFANYMGVSVKTVEAWERGTNHPVGSACRLINMLENQKDLALKLTVSTNKKYRIK